MEKGTRANLAKVAKEKALIPFHGYVDGKDSNLEPIISLFPKLTLRKADGLWCAAYVYYCCRETGFDIPVIPRKYTNCHLGGCNAWEKFAINDNRIEYYEGTEKFNPEAGDIVIYDRVFNNTEHDHMGIVLKNLENTIIVAEGNINNILGVIERPKDEHIRGYIRISDGYTY